MVLRFLLAYRHTQTPPQWHTSQERYLEKDHKELSRPRAPQGSDSKFVSVKPYEMTVGSVTTLLGVFQTENLTRAARESTQLLPVNSAFQPADHVTSKGFEDSSEQRERLVLFQAIQRQQIVEFFCQAQATGEFYLQKIKRKMVGSYEKEEANELVAAYENISLYGGKCNLLSLSLSYVGNQS